ncbi:MBL fold metallo-hydrolase [Paenibacillus sp. MMS20-IR301]|uniref:MBL fold metallo-hydrolase n=1 Tax=Paenibacillus sp. MMS20-IR301 TaxID=2895946 RepID=UPI0028F1195F|nr:MBL fold metallo-hydrolase [Paenibacillus sp. MMS20-IR301]WNS41942.1 MBL fold metallo-hydrolase [Paenibacillus sp. MMS20-IR301]
MYKWKCGPVTLFQSDLYMTNSIVVETAECVLVTDPCWLPREVEEIRSYVQDILGGRRLLLLFTHSDFDHIIGYGAFKGAEVIASRAFMDKSEVEREEILEQIRTFDDSYYLQRDYEITYPQVDHVVEQEGQSLSFGDLQLTGYAAPGHTNDGLFTVVEGAGLLIAGDYLSDVEFPYIYDSSLSYEATLGKLDLILSRHPVTLLVPGHGEAADSRLEMERRKQESREYIHKLRTAAASGSQKAVDALIAGCAFPRNMSKFHKSNQELIVKEMAAGAGS